MAGVIETPNSFHDRFHCSASDVTLAAKQARSAARYLRATKVVGPRLAAGGVQTGIVTCLRERRVPFQ